MRKFADLHLKPKMERREQVENLIRKVSELGYSLVAVSLPPRASQETFRFLHRICEEYGVDLASRLDLRPKHASELLKRLRRLRRRFEVVGVECNSKQVARQAAKDRRVDLLVFPSRNPRRRFFDASEARLAAQGRAALEVDVGMVLSCRGFDRMTLLRCLREELRLARKSGVPVVFCSGAEDWLGSRGPHDLGSLAHLLGMGTEEALDAVSTVPCRLVERNRRKLDERHVLNGVYVVRGENCE